MHAADNPTVRLACLPETEEELQQHKSFLDKKGFTVSADTPDEHLVLQSRLVAVLDETPVLDSIHHGSAAELWAMATLCDFDAVMWSEEVDANVHVRTQERISDAQARHMVSLTPIRFFFQQLGCVGHFDVIPSSETCVRPLPVTTWLQWWRNSQPHFLLEDIGLQRKQRPCEKGDKTGVHTPHIPHEISGSQRAAQPLASEPTCLERSPTLERWESARSQHFILEDIGLQRNKTGVRLNTRLCTEQVAEGALDTNSEDSDVDSRFTWNATPMEHEALHTNSALPLETCKTWDRVEDRDRRHVAASSAALQNDAVQQSIVVRKG